MTKTYKLSTIQHVVEIGARLSGSWFRGHSRIIGELTPGVFRREYDCPPFRSRRDIEFDLITKFKLNAPSLESNLPDYDDPTFGMTYCDMGLFSLDIDYLNYF